MSGTIRRYVVNMGELLDPAEFTADPETECQVVGAEDYDALADQLRGAVDLLREFDGHRVDSSLAWMNDWTRRVGEFVASRPGCSDAP